MSNKTDILITILRILLPKFGNIVSTSIKEAIIMEENNFSKVYMKMRKSGLTTVDNLIKWMQEAKIIDETLLTERRVRMMFPSTEKGVQVELEEFQTIMERVSTDTQKLVEDVTQIVSDTSKMMEALTEAAEAFEEKNKE